MAYKWIEYMCRYCGIKTQRSVPSGRPSPGNCLRRGTTRDGRSLPHAWSVSRRW